MEMEGGGPHAFEVECTPSSMSMWLAWVLALLMGLVVWAVCWFTQYVVPIEYQPIVDVLLAVIAFQVSCFWFAYMSNPRRTIDLPDATLVCVISIPYALAIIRLFTQLLLWSIDAACAMGPSVFVVYGLFLSVAVRLYQRTVAAE